MPLQNILLFHQVLLFAICLLAASLNRPEFAERRKTVILLISACLILYGLGSPILIVSVIMVEQYSPDCRGAFARYYDITLSVALGTLGVIALLGMIYTVAANWKSKEEKRKSETKHQVMYDIIANRDFKLERYIKDKRKDLEERHLSKRELRVLIDNCRKRYGSSKRSETCPICTELFRKDDDVIHHPRCEHVFHVKCLVPWLERNSTCPCCKQSTRINLLRSLRRQALEPYYDEDDDE